MRNFGLRAAAAGAARIPSRMTSVLPWVEQRRIRLLLGPPPLGPDGVWSAVDPHAALAQHPTPELIELVLQASTHALSTHVSELAHRARLSGSASADWVDVFPGEHYRFLTGLTRALRPSSIVEIGTYTGASALAFLAASTETCQIVSYDIIPWDEIPGTLLVEKDFAGDRLAQRVMDLSDPVVWESESDVFGGADIIFLDGPKDGVFEPLMLERIAGLGQKKPIVLVVDDIRFLEMLKPWAGFPSPKIDATSFGHWSGTGVAVVGGGPEWRERRVEGDS